MKNMKHKCRKSTTDNHEDHKSEEQHEAQNLNTLIPECRMSKTEVEAQGRNVCSMTAYYNRTSKSRKSLSTSAQNIKNITEHQDTV